jgi:hypothetical protein
VFPYGERSTSVRGEPSVSNTPTPMQWLTDEHATPFNAAFCAPTGFALDVMDQWPRANVFTSVRFPAEPVARPTATQLAARAHATPLRPLCALPDGSALATTFHDAPFHASISVLRVV